MNIKWPVKLAAAVVVAVGTSGLANADAFFPAFPGAEGYGAVTQGGRTGKVFEVTNLQDSGEGSLRAAVEAQGPRIVVFRVSGTIELARDITIRQPFITIAGQTAPGDGICLKNYKLMASRTNDVIVRDLRIRRGAESGRQDDGIGVEFSNNVIIDHCTVSWTCDEAVNTWHGASNTTIQWCMISEALHDAIQKGHGFAATLGGQHTSYHHNLIANCPGRNPSVGGNDEFQTMNMDYRNNVIFNWGSRVIDGKPNSINVVNNYYKPGPQTELKGEFAKIDKPAYSKNMSPTWYIAGNVMDGEPELSGGDKGVTGAVEFRVDKPCDFMPINMTSAEQAYKDVLEGAGATVPKRDPVDLRIVEEVKTGKTTYGNGIVRKVDEVGGWPELKSAEAPVDTDHDGMPDWWEIKYKLDPKDAADGNKDLNGDGYTNVEKYINGIDPANKVDWRNPANNKNTLTADSLKEPGK